LILSIASGKGGTGKTTVAVNLARSLGRVQLLDCDVEAPNDHLLIHPKEVGSRPVHIMVPRVLEERCDYCGKCSEFCNFNAIFVAQGKILIFSELCHSCGGCSKVCPRKAIVEEEKEVGRVRWGRSGDIELVWGELKVSEPVPGPVIEAVKDRMQRGETVIIDAAPGASCPVVDAVYGSDFCLLVTEPTPFGLHDLKMIVEVIKIMGIPVGVVVNRAGIGDRGVYDYCEGEGIPILLEIPFDRRIAELYSRGVPFVEEMPEWRERFLSLFEKIREEVRG